MKKIILNKPKVTYRQFCLIQNDWIELWTSDNEQEVISSMHPKLQSKLEKVVITESGKEETTLLWTNKENN